MKISPPGIKLAKKSGTAVCETNYGAIRTCSRSLKINLSFRITKERIFGGGQLGIKRNYQNGLNTEKQGLKWPLNAILSMVYAMTNSRG